MKELPIRSLPGIPLLLALLAAVAVGVYLAIGGFGNGLALQGVAGVLLAVQNAYFGER